MNSTDFVLYLKDSPFEAIGQEDNSIAPTSFNKLAQLPTDEQKADYQKLTKKARSKWYTENISMVLAELNDSPLVDYYKNSLTCNQVLSRKGQKITSKYCNCRNCHNCNRIRTAKAINHYGVQLKEIRNLHFTTLTIRNVKADELKKAIEKMIKQLSNLIRVLREKKGIKLSGIRKLEITYNSKEDTYHPHFHILHSENCGNMIIDEWMKRYKNDTDIKAQHTTQANDDSVNELFKYSTKIMIHNEDEPGTISVYIKAIDVILCSLYKKRTFQTFGTIKSASEEIEGLQSQEFNSFDEELITAYVWNQHDWYDIFTDEPLVKYKPPNVKFKYYE